MKNNFYIFFHLAFKQIPLLILIALTMLPFPHSPHSPHSPRQMVPSVPVSPVLSPASNLRQFVRLILAEEPEFIIHSNEFENGKKVLTTFTDVESEFHRRWVVLLAFPQSGKTTTFLFVACEMLRLQKIKNVIIMCGNADIDLKSQLIESKESFIQNAYDAYLEETLHCDSRTRRAFIHHAKSKISILFGADLDSSRFEVRNTLIIWEEAHCAQDRTNRPHRYLQGVNITADGDVSNLCGARNNYVLTVSATPFSELSNVVHCNQSKRIVKMIPGVNYIGPRQFIEQNSVIQFDHTNRMDALKCAMRDSELKHQNVPKYCIVRFIGNENVDECGLAAAEVGWNVKMFDSKTTSPSSMRSMNELSVAPIRNTLVIIRGKCRMGKRVPKTHISFVFESSMWSATDVLLQALFARMFGYDANIDIKIYISDKIQMSEVWKYVEMMEDVDDEQPVKVLPKHAKNLTTTRIHKWDDTIPIIFRTDDDAAVEYFGRTDIIQKIKTAFNQMNDDNEQQQLVRSNVIENYNPEAQTAEIARQISNAPVERNTDAFKVVIHLMTNDSGEPNATYAEMPARMRESIETRNRLNSGNLAGCGFASDDEAVIQVNLWIFNTNHFEGCGFKHGDIVIHARTPHVVELHDVVPMTTKLETFATFSEDGLETRSNGGYLIPMPVETAYNLDAMKSYLSDMIRISQSPDIEVVRPNFVTSNHDGISKWNGITLSSEVLEAIQKGGEIYNHTKREFKIKLKIHKMRGREPIEFVQRCLSRITKIEWI